MPLYGKHFENNLIMFQRKLTSKHEHCLHLAPVAVFPQRGISLRFCRWGALFLHVEAKAQEMKLPWCLCWMKINYIHADQ